MKPVATFFMERPSRQRGRMSPSAVNGCITVLAISRCNSWNCSTVWRLGRCGFLFDGFKVTIGFEGFVVDFVKRWNARVPLEQRGGLARAGDRVRIQLPHRINHRMVMRIQYEALVFRVARNMK